MQVEHAHEIDRGGHNETIIEAVRDDVLVLDPTVAGGGRSGILGEWHQTSNAYLTIRRDRSWRGKTSMNAS